MDIETNANGDVVISESSESSTEQTVETVLEAATEIAEKIDEARQEGEAAAGAAADVGAIALVTLDTLNARFDALESRLSAMFDVLGEIRTVQIMDEFEEEEIPPVSVDEIPPAVDNSNTPTEITVEENNGEIKVEEVTAAVVPEIRPSKKARFI